MTPYKQINKHDPDNGVWGDCWRTAWGCVLDLSPWDVPHFVDGGVENFELLESWLAERGLVRIVVPYIADLEDVLKTIGHYNPGVRYFLTGKSATGVSHVVVCCGDKIEHDPSRDDSGIVGPCEGGIYWVEFIGSLASKGAVKPVEATEAA